MTRSRVLAALAVVTFAVVACEDDNQTQVGPAGRSSFDRYVAMGTSVSMGVRNASNAVTAETQIQAWPSLLARQAGAVSFRLPLMRPGGCLSPNVAPLSLSINLAGRVQQSPLAPDTVSCAGLQAGIILPTNNVAITGARVDDAVRLTPESVAVRLSECAIEPPPPAVGGVVVCRTDFPRRKIMPLVLLAKQTQVTAMVAQQPTFVSVELGANDVLGIITGRATVGPPVFAPNSPTITEDSTFVRAYNQVIAAVEGTKAKAVLLTLPTSIEGAASLRTGAEFLADSIAFSRDFYITVGSECATTNGGNYMVVPGYVFTNIGIGRARLGLGAPRHVMTCADSGANKQDFVLTPAELALANGAIAGFNAHITSVANSKGYALASLNSWFSKPKPAFSINTLVTGTTPYGKWFGLDGVHPTAAGQIEIANAVIAAINTKYSFEIPSIPAP